MKHFSQITDLPCLPLYEEFQNLMKHKKISWNGRQQICINSVPGYEDDTSYGAGALNYDWRKFELESQMALKDGVMEVPMRETPLEEQDFTVLCSAFKDTLFEEIHNSLTSKFKLGRLRIMQSKPKTCLTWHVDTTTRLHLPLKTQEGCFMVIEDEVFHIPENEWWHTNTKLSHTAFNGSKETRLHLVAAILD